MLYNWRNAATNPALGVSARVCGFGFTVDGVIKTQASGAFNACGCLCVARLLLQHDTRD